MKKILSITLCISLFLSCTKEKEVTFNHPVSADVEMGLETTSLSAEWLSGESGSTLGAKIGASKAGVILCMVPDNFEGDAAAWFASKLPSWSNAENSVGILSNGKYLFIMADPSVVVSALDNLVCATAGEFQIYLGSPTDAQIPQILSSTWYGAESSRVLYAFDLAGKSKVLEEATFADCLSAQLGTDAQKRSRFLYTSAGTWNFLSAIKESSDCISFTINAEEGKL